MAVKSKQSQVKSDSKSTETTLQDWIDIVWQSCINAKEKGVVIDFVEFTEDKKMAVIISGVVNNDGKPEYIAQVEQ